MIHVILDVTAGGMEQPSPACHCEGVKRPKQSVEKSEIASRGSEVGIKREEFREPHRSAMTGEEVMEPLILNYLG